MLGNFIWTAIDYIGESAIGANGHNSPDMLACADYCAQPWPYHISFCGDLDIVGGQKPQAFLRRVLWNNSKLEMAVHAPVASGAKEAIGAWGFPDERQSWSWDKASGSLSVNVYSNHECVKLFLNGKQQQPAANTTRLSVDGSDCVRTDRSSRFTATFQVPFQPGVLQAKSYVGGQEQAAVSFTTAKSAAKLRLSADRTAISAERSDLAYVLAEIVDADGVLVTCADEHAGSDCTPPTVTFSVSGAGELSAVGSGDPIDPGSFNGQDRKTYRGRATAIVRPGKLGDATVEPGTIHVTASAPGLGEAKLQITTTA